MYCYIPYSVVLLYSLQDRVHKPRETRYIFTPMESGNTEELCVKIELNPKTDKPTHLPPPSSESVTSEAPLTGKDLPTPSRSVSSPHLSGVWASRAQFIRPPLEPRDVLQLERTAPNSSTASLSNSTPNNSMTASVTSSGSGDSVRMPTQAQVFRGPTLRGAWSKPGSTGAQIVKGGLTEAPQQRPMFSIGQHSSDSEVSSESTTPSGHRTPNTPKGSHIFSSSSASKLSNPRTYQREYRQEHSSLSHSASGPALTGNREHWNKSKRYDSDIPKQNALYQRRFDTVDL